MGVGRGQGIPQDIPLENAPDMGLMNESIHILKNVIKIPFSGIFCGNS